MNSVGLDRRDVVTVFRRVLAKDLEKDPLLASVARAVGEVIEENNKKLWDQMVRALESRGEA